MTPRTSAIRSAVLAAPLVCALGAPGWAQVEPETALLTVPTARVAPAGAPSFGLGALVGDRGSSLRVPVAMVFTIGSGLEIGARLDDAGARSGILGGGLVRMAAKWAVGEEGVGWRVALAATGTRSVSGDSTASPWAAAGLRVTFAGYRVAWSGFFDYGSRRRTAGGVGVEGALSSATSLGLEARGGAVSSFEGLAWARRVLAPGISGWFGLGVVRRDGSTRPRGVLAFSVAPAQVYLVPRARPVVVAPLAAAGPAPSDVPDLAAALVVEEDRLARERAREQFLRNSAVVANPVRWSGGPGARDITTGWLTDTLENLPGPEGFAGLVTRIIAVRCERWVLDAGPDPRRVAMARRLLAFTGVDPADVEVRAAAPAPERTRPSPSSGVCRLR